MVSIKKWKENTWNFGNRLLVIHMGAINQSQESTSDWQRKAVRCAGHAHLFSIMRSKNKCIMLIPMNEQTITSQENPKDKKKKTKRLFIP